MSNKHHKSQLNIAKEYPKYKSTQTSTLQESSRRKRNHNNY